MSTAHASTPSLLQTLLCESSGFGPEPPAFTSSPQAASVFYQLGVTFDTPTAMLRTPYREQIACRNRPSTAPTLFFVLTRLCEDIAGGSDSGSESALESKYQMLSNAAFSGDLATAMMLLDAVDVDINARPSVYQPSVLHYAVLGRHLPVISLLIDRGASDLSDSSVVEACQSWLPGRRLLEAGAQKQQLLHHPAAAQ